MLFAAMLDGWFFVSPWVLGFAIGSVIVAVFIGIWNAVDRRHKAVPARKPTDTPAPMKSINLHATESRQ